jgi:predicted NBD/HSP70 family sugar kinase
MHDDRRLVEERLERVSRQRILPAVYADPRPLELAAWHVPGEPVPVGTALIASGSHGVAGEIGHIGVDVRGPACHCGGRGCVEAIAGTDAIVGRARKRDGRPELTFDDAVALARGGDKRVGAVFAEAGNAIGCGIAAVANLVGPARIVVSGEGLAAYDLFETHICTGFERQAFGAAAQCPLSIRPLPFEEWARHGHGQHPGTCRFLTPPTSDPSGPPTAARHHPAPNQEV